MTETQSTYEKQILAAIGSVVSAFQSNPHDFLYESDIQGVLLAEIRHRTTGTSIKVDRKNGSGGPYNLGVAYSEYHHRIDIACLNVQDAASHGTEPYMGYDTFIYDLPVLIGIEIKYRKMGDVFTIRDCFADMGKLTGLNVPKPIALGFVQSSGADAEHFFSARPDSDWSTRRLVRQVGGFDSVYGITPNEIWEYERMDSSAKQPVTA